MLAKTLETLYFHKGEWGDGFISYNSDTLDLPKATHVQVKHYKEDLVLLICGEYYRILGIKDAALKLEFLE